MKVLKERPEKLRSRRPKIEERQEEEEEWFEVPNIGWNGKEAQDGQDVAESGEQEQEEAAE